MILEIMENPSRFHEVLQPDFEAGTLTWKWRDPEVWGIAANKFNGARAGKPAFATLDNDGRLTGTLGSHSTRKRYYAHRVLWAMYYGDWPQGEIDHIDGNPANNAISNLRDVTTAENRRNMPMMRNNKSGHVGVRYCRWGWQAYICADRKRSHLGFFKTKEQAIAARRVAEIQMGFHQNHGRKAA
jgi:hypothetical protein